GTGSINQGTDEFIELYIKTAGLDLTNWTIELLDGTNVIGALTSTGAFDDSNYITSGSGTFTNTEIGDFLVLGDVDGTGKMNNSITINLKDSGGVIILSLLEQELSKLLVEMQVRLVMNQCKEFLMVQILI
ncbi:hypothetical protein N9473_04970, partial [Polaribacter sp.]|nr:hypothetical protein [Polaribacter sp.]